MDWSHRTRSRMLQWQREHSPSPQTIPWNPSRSTVPRSRRTPLEPASAWLPPRVRPRRGGVGNLWMSIHIGEAGIQVGNAYWELYCLEHDIKVLTLFAAALLEKQSLDMFLFLSAIVHFYHGGADA